MATETAPKDNPKPVVIPAQQQPLKSTHCFTSTSELSRLLKPQAAPMLEHNTRPPTTRSMPLQATVLQVPLSGLMAVVTTASCWHCASGTSSVQVADNTASVECCLSEGL